MFFKSLNTRSSDRIFYPFSTVNLTPVKQTRKRRLVFRLLHATIDKYSLSCYNTCITINCGVVVMAKVTRSLFIGYAVVIVLGLVMLSLNVYALVS